MVEDIVAPLDYRVVPGEKVAVGLPFLPKLAALLLEFALLVTLGGLLLLDEWLTKAFLIPSAVCERMLPVPPAFNAEF